MPGEDGLSLCRWLAAQGGPPVVLLTALADDADRIVGLELGVDDYVVKPFNPRELLAPIRTVLRRAAVPEPAVSAVSRRFGPWRHEAAARTVTPADGRVVALKLGEDRLLSVLLDHPLTAQETRLGRRWSCLSVPLLRSFRF